MSKIIFGGDFDPIHLGHINMAKCASDYLNCDVIFVPAKVSVWKESSVNSADKINMLKIAISDYKRFYIDEFEINQKDKNTYSIDTIKYFLSKNSGEKFYFLIGADQVNKFHLWKSADEIANLVSIIYFNRPGYEINVENVKRFKMQQIPGYEIDASATNIRDLNDLKLDYKVIKYIEQNNLYYIPKIKSYFNNDKRFKHVLSVADLAYHIALNNNLINPDKAYIAGILHDIGKEYEKTSASKIMDANFKQYINMGTWSYHQFIGSYIANKDFGITDKSILNAIKFHATGNSNMDDLGKIVYAADKIDPTRGFDSKDLIDSMMKDLNSGFITVLKANKDYLEQSKKDIYNELTYNCFKFYL